MRSTKPEIDTGAREAGASAGDRREFRVEAIAAGGFAGAAWAMFNAFDGQAADLWTLGLLVVVCAFLVRVEFEVGEGCTRPVQLVLAPMLLLLPAGAVPIAIVAGHVAAKLPEVLRGRKTVRGLLMSVGDAWFSLGPAVVVGLTGIPSDVPRLAAVVVVAALAQFAVDFVVSAVRVCVGAGYELRALLRPFAWVWLVDVLLIPVGLCAAVVAEHATLTVAGVLPLAVLLAIFARERTGRIENAMALQRMAQEGQDRLQSIVQNASDLIAIVREDGTVTTLTGLVAPVFGSDWQAVQGRSVFEQVHPDDAPVVAALLRSVGGKALAESQEGEWRMRYRDGSHRHVAAVATNLLHDERVGGIVLTIRDVEERKAFEEQLRHRAFHDALTGLANRGLFYDRVEHALAQGTRESAQVAALFIDLDDFKPINDRFGHAHGDRLLEQVARRLDSCLRSVDTAARLGGDEFGVLLGAVGDPSAADRAAVRMLEALAQPFEVDGTFVSLSASVGLVVSEPGDRGVEELLAKADLAMYEAKRKGKHRAERYHASLEVAGPGGRRGAWFQRDEEDREEIHSILEDASALTMVFQPLMDLRTGRVSGYESLARFNREPRRPPNEWFAQAHRCGLGYALEATAIAAALATPGRPTGAYLSVNLSPSSLVTEEVMAVLPADLRGLVVEITENELASGDRAVEEALADLRRRGARLAVDDVGAGYAGLTHVMRLAPDIIKLDRALTTGVDTDAVKAALIGSFVRYARDIDATVCAEGVETLQELERLADLDVTYGQGYVIARPAAPWVGVTAAAAAACLSSFEASLTVGTDTPGRADHDRRLEQLARRLAEAESERDVTACLIPITEELRADEVRILAHNDASSQIANQLLIGDPLAGRAAAAGLRQQGFSSRLSLPVVTGGRTVGWLEAYSVEERPWSRFEIDRGRIIAHQLGATMDRTGIRLAASDELRGHRASSAAA